MGMDIRKSKAYPSAMRMKSANPCAMTVRSLFSMTLGRTVKDVGRLASPFGNTFTDEHSVQVTLVGAWMAALTSARSK